MQFFVSGSKCSQVIKYGNGLTLSGPATMSIHPCRLSTARLPAVFLRSVRISPPIFPMVSHGPPAPNGFAFRRSYPVLLSMISCRSTDSPICIIPHLIMNLAHEMQMENEHAHPAFWRLERDVPTEINVFILNSQTARLPGFPAFQPFCCGNIPGKYAWRC